MACAGRWSLLTLLLASCTPKLTFENTGTLPAPATPEDETKSAVSRVEGSGPLAADVAAPVQQAADQLFEKTFGQPSKARCFQAGCLHQVIYQDRCALLRASTLIGRSPSLPIFRVPWTIQKTPPLRLPDGRLSVTWALLISNPRDPRFVTALNEPVPPPVKPEAPCPDQGNAREGKAN